MLDIIITRAASKISSIPHTVKKMPIVVKKLIAIYIDLFQYRDNHIISQYFFVFTSKTIFTKAIKLISLNENGQQNVNFGKLNMKLHLN